MKLKAEGVSSGECLVESNKVRLHLSRVAIFLLIHIGVHSQSHLRIN
jgi:hypothetical protein